MALRSIKSFEQRWGELRRLAKAQLKDFEKDKRELSRQIKRYKVERDLARLRHAVAHTKRVEKVIKGTKALIATKNSVVRQAKRRGRLLRRALT